DAGVGHRLGARLELLAVELLAVVVDELLVVEVVLVEDLVFREVGDEDAALLEHLHEVLEVLLLGLQVEALHGAPERVADLLGVRAARLLAPLEQRLDRLGGQPRGPGGRLRRRGGRVGVGLLGVRLLGIGLLGRAGGALGLPRGLLLGLGLLGCGLGALALRRLALGLLLGLLRVGLLGVGLLRDGPRRAGRALVGSGRLG